ncbi:MAG TPA: HAD family hydrolase [Desulfurococcales archaeon]|nr:HAD family hydrolase [Desulfurococcales archaeon]
MGKRFNLKDLRFNPRPPPVKGGREFSRDYYEAFYKIEDVFSHYVLGNIDFDHAVKSLNYARYAIIPKLGYPKDVKEELLRVYDEAVKLLYRLRSRDKVKEWLLSNGPPREAKVKSLTDFM